MELLKGTFHPVNFLIVGLTILTVGGIHAFHDYAQSLGENNTVIQEHLLNQ